MLLSKPMALASLSLWCVAAHAQTAASSDSANPTPQATPTNSTPPRKAEVESGETIEVTATRNPEPLAQTTSAITVVTRQQIEQKKPFDIVDVLRLAPSLAVFRSGTFGKTVSVFLRGTNSNHTLVLIDGVRANSPADGRFDFGTVPVENIERIEVLRGPQSALYGSDAMGGVINIITRRGTGAFRTGGDVEFGNYGTNRQVVTARGDLGKGGLSFSATRLHSNGLFANDDYRNLATSLRYDRALSAKANLAFIGQIDSANEGTPGQRLLAFDPNARSKPRDIFGTIQYTNEASRRRDRITLGAFDQSLRLNDPINPTDPPAAQSFDIARLKDRVLTLDAQSAWTMGQHTLTAGGELRDEHASNDTKATFGNTNFSRGTTTRALFAQDEFRTGHFALVPGVRLEDNSQFGNDLNGRLAAAYYLNPKSKLKGTIGTGFRAPAIYELYYPQSGDPNLQPEKSVGYELGYEHTLPRDGRLELTLFRNQFRNLIGTVAVPKSPTYPFGFKAGNVNRARTQGLEIGFNQPLGNGLRAVLNQSFLTTSSTGAPLLRRPRFVSTADLLYRRNRFDYDFGLVAQGHRFDNDFAAPPFGKGRGAGIYGGYTRFDLTVAYDVRPGMQIYTRVQNLFNRRYEEVAGFPAPHLNFVVGVQTRAF